jgi:hypothetical protein
LLNLLLIFTSYFIRCKNLHEQPKKTSSKERNQSEEEKKRRMAEGIGEEGENWRKRCKKLA